MKAFILLGVICLVALMHHAAGYSSGAPTNACEDLVPQHRVPAQKDPCPYVITVSKREIKVGEPIKVTITGKKGEKFKGFMCQAHEQGRVGDFQEADGVQIVNCSPGKQDAVTHINADEKSKVEFTWVASEKLNKPLTFVCTVAKDGGTFWVAEKSEPISVK
ncbi:putative defense protein Hdd11 [Schistocerca gregaria]|uniref:putative defense protein Hdd11 n=1 Tax=Schistocerca gregaria TaxID=7010 RepID=UPI00211DB756|nr:putative defense protein Hdd11 [Schistocerca gregaria]